MPIVAAEIEANGWVLRLTLAASLTMPNTDFGAYGLDADGAARLVLTSSHAGFVKSAGTAVAGIHARRIVATWPLRLPVNPAAPTVKLLDEADLGGGLIRVRLALSETIYATDTGLSLAALAGWRAGEGVHGGLSVTNASTIVAPVPIFRWALPSYEVATGSFRLSLIVASHHPVGFDPVAGVKFTVTDGTRTKTVWATALDTDNSYGDNLRCHTVIIDPATVTALTAGLLRCDAEVYPWLGSMRSTDPLGTRSLATLSRDGVRVGAESPFVVGYDPALTRYSSAFAYVDPVNGTATASTAMIATTLAGAKAVAAASRPRSISTALQAYALINRTLPAANGQAAATRSSDGLRIVLAPGTHNGVGTTTISSTNQTAQIPVVVEGDPDDSDPRNTCQIVTQASGNFNLRSAMFRFRNLTIRTGGAGMAGPPYIWLDRVTVYGRTGDEAVTTAPFTNTIVAGNANLFITGSRIWRSGWRIGAGSPQCGLFRGNENARQVNAITILKNRYIPVGEDGTTNGVTSEGYATWVTSLYQGALEDVFLAYNDIRDVRWEIWNTTRVPAATAGTAFPRVTRLVFLNNVFERTSDTGNTSDAFWAFASSSTSLTSYCIFEGNTHAGGGYSAFYNAPTQVTVADTDTAFSETMVIRVANNATDRNASKQDDFNDSITLGIRNAAGDPRGHGYRPQLIQCWDTHWGVNKEANVDFSRKGTISADRHEFFGLRSSQYVAATAPEYADDRSESATNIGLGDYTPLAGSALLGRVTRGNSDRDWAGNARLANGAAGAIEAVAAALPTVTPGSARHSHGAAASMTQIVLAVEPAGAVHGSAAGAPVIDWGATIAGAATVLSLASGASAIDLGDGSGVLIDPDDSRLVLPSAPTLLLPSGSGSAERLLLVRADARTFFVTETKQEI